MRLRHRNDDTYGKSRKLNTFYTVDNKEQSLCLSLMRDTDREQEREIVLNGRILMLAPKNSQHCLSAD